MSVEQLAVLWPVLWVWHPTLLQSRGTGLLDVVRFSGVELLIKHSINHVRAVVARHPSPIVVINRHASGTKSCCTW